MSTQRRFDAVTSLLRDPSLGQRFDDEMWEDVLHILRESDLLGTLCHLAIERGVFASYTDYAQRHLLSMKVYSARQAHQVAYECDLIRQRLQEAGVQCVFLKGAGYTLRKSCNSLGRIYSDIDVWVAKEQIDTAQAALRKDAWYSPPITDYDQRYYRQWAHELPPMKHLTRRTVLDLHHNIVPPVGGRAPDMSHLLEGVVVTGGGLLVLSAPAATLHSLIHLFNNEDWSSAFRDLIDLYLLLEEFGDGDFWRTLLALANKTGFIQELVYGVVLLEQVLAYSAPESVREELSQRLVGARKSLLVKHVFVPALRPHHPLVCAGREKLAIQMTYVRGHWIKMPLPILVGHLSMKAGMAIGNKVLGKHRSTPVLE